MTNSTLAYEIFSEYINNEEFGMNWDLKEKLKKGALIAGVTAGIVGAPMGASGLISNRVNRVGVLQSADASKTAREFIVNTANDRHYNPKYYEQRMLKELQRDPGMTRKAEGSAKRVKDKYGSWISRKEFKDATGVSYRDYYSGIMKANKLAKEAKKAKK